MERKLEDFRNKEQSKDKILNILLNNKEIYKVSYEAFNKLIGRKILDTPKGKKFFKRRMRELIQNYYYQTFKERLEKQATRFVKKLSMRSLAGGVVGYFTNGEEGAINGFLYGASLFTTAYLIANGLSLIGRINTKSSLEQTIEDCQSEIKKSIGENVKIYRNPVVNVLESTIASGLIVAGFSYLHDWVGSNINYINEIVKNAADNSISAFKIGALMGLTAFVSEYKRAIKFMRENYQGLDKAIFTNRLKKARTSLGNPTNLEGFTRMNREGILETPVIYYIGPNKNRITLIGAIHIGEREYYHKLQKELDTHDKVFYEGVGKEKFFQRISGGGFFLTRGLRYKEFANQYSLCFQKDGINYKRENWENVDVNAGEVIKRINKAKSIPKWFGKQSLLYLGGVLVSVFSHLFTNVFYIREGKLTEILTKDDKNGLFDEIILSYRNQVVIDKLEKWNKENKGSVAVFYGAAHLEELHKHLIKNMNYKVKEIKWVEAW